MALKSDAKFKEKLAPGFKSDMRDLVNFNASSGKSENLQFDVLLLSKVYYVWDKKDTEELCVITLKNDAKFEEKQTLKKWHEKFGEFWPQHLAVSEFAF